MADFELICNNAMTYNQKRSRVHKSAAIMLRAGMKQLQAAELPGRKVWSLPVATALYCPPHHMMHAPSWWHARRKWTTAVCWLPEATWTCMLAGDCVPAP